MDRRLSSLQSNYCRVAERNNMKIKNPKNKFSPIYLCHNCFRYNCQSENNDCSYSFLRGNAMKFYFKQKGTLLIKTIIIHLVEGK